MLPAEEGGVLIAMAGSRLPTSCDTLPSEQLFFAPPPRMVAILGIVLRGEWFRGDMSLRGVSREISAWTTQTCQIDWSEEGLPVEQEVLTRHGTTLAEERSAWPKGPLE